MSTQNEMVKKNIVLTGPTGSGKTALAVAYAQQYNAVIISADSRQIYRFMDIGTAKPTTQERLVPHYLIDIRNPDESYSAADFGNDARALITQFEQEEREFLIVGGSGFYINSLLYKDTMGHPSDARIREQLAQRLQKEGAAVLFSELQQHDPCSASRIHKKDHYRILRALEIITLTGKAVTVPQQTENTAYQLVALHIERHDLYARIEQRVDAMFRAGLVDEVRALTTHGFGWGQNALHTVGYAEVLRMLDGTYTEAEAVSLVKQNTRRYAKRQLTWFRKKNVAWLAADTEMQNLVMQLRRIREGEV